MAKELMRYRAALFRGWDVVRVEYVLEEGALLMRRKGSWSAVREQRVELGSLSGEVRRETGRQPACAASTMVLLGALLILGIDVAFKEAGASGPEIDWRLWGPMLALGVLAWVVRRRTRRAAEWSHFVAKGQGLGVYVLKDERDGEGHDRFVSAVKKRAG